MLLKIFNVIKDTFSRNSKKDTALTSNKGTLISSSSRLPEFLENPDAEFIIQVNKEGEFVIATECASFSEESVHFVAMALHMLNSGHLVEFFTESLSLWGGEDVEKQAFVSQVLTGWHQIQTEGIEGDLSNSEPAVSPKEVFSLYKLGGQ